MDFLKSHTGEKQPPTKEQSLTTLLSAEQCAELTLLVGSASGAMRKTIEDAFDASQIGAATEASNKGNPNVAQTELSVEERERQRQAAEKRERELSAPRLKELRAAALEHFHRWRDSVLGRVGEVVNARDTGDGPKVPKDTAGSHAGDNGGSHGEGVDSALERLYPPLSTPLTALRRDERVLILHSMLLLILSLEHYNAHSRVLLLYLTSSLHLPLDVFSSDETKVAQGLLEAAKQMTGDDETQKRSEDNKTARRWKVGLASVAGAAIIGVTGGLAAPLIAAGLGGALGGLGLGATAAAGYLGMLAGSGVLVGSLFGAYGGRMTGKMMDAYAREVQDFAFLPVHEVQHGIRKRWSSAKESSPEDRRLRVAIGITGWLTDEAEVVAPWRVLGHAATEPFALRWELSALLDLGNSLTTMVTSAAWGYAKKEILKRTIFASLAAALWPIGLLKVSRIVDNPFSVAKARAEKAGEVLADALINKAQGERPVTLVGYSLGARAIHACLLSLAQRRAFGLVESVVLLGAPLPSDAADWRVMRSVVAGRLVNVYSENDYILGFLYRTSSIQLGVAGLQAVSGVAGVQNVDVSAAVSGHLRYRYLVGSVLKRIGFEDVDLAEVAKEEEVLRLVQADEKRREANQGANTAAADEADIDAAQIEDESRRKDI